MFHVIHLAKSMKKTDEKVIFAVETTTVSELKNLLIPLFEEE